MKEIIRDLLRGKINMRLVVTWAFVLFAMVMAGRMLLAITEAVEAVAGYVEVNPYVVAGRK